MTMTLYEAFLSHKRYNGYTVDKGNVLGWQLNYVAHYDYRSCLFYICTYAMCSSFLKAVTETLLISVEAA